MITPSSQMTSQDFLLWSNLPVGRMRGKKCTGREDCDLTTWAEVHVESAHPDPVLTIGVREAVDPLLVHIDAVDAQIPEEAKEGSYALVLPVPLDRGKHPLRDAGKVDLDEISKEASFKADPYISRVAYEAAETHVKIFTSSVSRNV
jgi:hypothetical protein